MSEQRSTLEDTVARLENRLAIHRRIGLAAFAMLGAVFLFGAAPGSLTEVRARKFILEGADGVPKAFLASHKGSTFLSLADARGVTKVKVIVNQDGSPELSFIDDREKPLIRLREHRGAVQLMLADGFSGEQIQIGQIDDQFGIDLVSRDTLPTLKLRNGSKQPQVAAVAKDVGGIVQIFAQNTNSGVSVSGSAGTPGIVLSMLDNLRPLLLLERDESRQVLTPASAPRQASNNTATDR